MGEALYRVAPGELGGLIRTARKASGITNEGLGQAIGITPIYVSNIQTGRATPSLPLLRRIAEFLRAPELLRAALLGEAGEPQPDIDRPTMIPILARVFSCGHHYPTKKPRFKRRGERIPGHRGIAEEQPYAAVLGDDCLSPLADEGDIVIASRKRKPKNGDLVLAKCSQGFMCCRVFFETRGGVVMQCVNPRYKPETISRAKLVGVHPVLEIRRRQSNGVVVGGGGEKVGAH